MPPARSKDQTNSALAKGAIDQFAPHWLKPYIEKAKPVFAVIAKGADAAWPYCQKAYALGQQGYTMIEPYGPAELAPMFIGVMMMLFGGYFTILIACVEAYRICGWETTSKSLQIIHENYTNVRDANKKDDEVDEDGNGVADVNEIDEKQLISRKLLLVARTIDPTHISNALSGIYSGFVAVMASLQVVFARTLALGVAIGDVLNKYAVKYLHPIGESVVPPEYHKWIDVVIGYAMKSIGISIAWWLQRIVSAVHSAMRGAQLFTTHFATYTAKRGYTHLSEGYWDEAFSVVCAVFGLYLQLSTAFSMPWILAILLFPLLAVENVLQWVVSFKIV